MKSVCLIILSLVVLLSSSLEAATDISEWRNPDDVMLRKPTKKKKRKGSALHQLFGGDDAAAERKAVDEAAQKAEAEKKAADEAARKAAAQKAEAERLAAERKADEERLAKAEAARVAAEKKAADEAARKAAEQKAAAEAQARREAERRAAAEKAARDAQAATAQAQEARRKADAQAAAQVRELEARIAAEKRAREEAEAAKNAAVAAKKVAEQKAAEAVADKAEAEAAGTEAVQKLQREREARQRAEASARAAQARADAERKMADKAVADKAALEKRLDYLKNPDPDERAVPKKLVPTGNAKDVTETASAQPVAERPPAKTDGKAAASVERPAVITAERTDYDRKEGVILFDRNVYVDDAQYQMHADRLFVFLDGTNDLKRLVAIGHVAITNVDKSAACAKAVFTKKTSKIVMYGDEGAKAFLQERSKKGDNVVQGDRITFWLNSEQVEIEGPAVSMPGGMLKGGSGKDLLDQMKGQ